MDTDCKSLPPKKRPLTDDIDNHDEKRRKYPLVTYPYNFFLVQNYMFMYAYASMLSCFQQQM
jgi:hypothetical protein